MIDESTLAALPTNLMLLIRKQSGVSDEHTP
jgi:hypothetical protein